MRPRVRVPPCKFCAKTFRRTEHLRRHERIHTKEKPFECFCGEVFSRSDLLSRHNRLAHGSNDPTHVVEDGHHDVVMNCRPAGAAIMDRPSPTMIGHDIESQTTSEARVPDPPANQYGAADGGTNDLSPSSRHFPTRSPRMPSEYDLNTQDMPNPPVTLAYDNSGAHGDGNSAQPQWEALFGDDLDLLWGSMGVNSAILAPHSFNVNYPMNFLSVSHNGISELGLSMFPDNSEPEIQQESRILSRSGSRLPSIQPPIGFEQSASESVNGSSAADGRPLQPLSATDESNTPWRLSKTEYCAIHDTIQEHASVLPSDFTMPSRHALSRYVEGYFSGFHDHLPFIHLPTINISSEAPELIFAIAATGARYRFQRRQSHHLYLAAKALLDVQLRQRDEFDPPASVFNTPGALSVGNLQSHSQVNPAGVGSRLDTSAFFAPRGTTENRNRDLRTMQAMIILMALATWNHRSLLKEAFSIATQLACMVREDGLEVPEKPSSELNWTDWVLSEGRRRTKLVAFCFLNLHSVAYNIPPKLMNTEIGIMMLPCPESHWRADTEEEWVLACKNDIHIQRPVHKGYADLFLSSADVSDRETISSFGNYVLIHCLLQQVFFTRQLSFHSDKGDSAALPPESLLRYESALQMWQQTWEATKDSSLDPSAPGGPLSFNSTALFRLAYIRLHANFGPCRQLETRDATSIARAFYNAPLLERSPSVCRAVLQSAHSLSIPVRIGIEFVARTQTLNWSIVHSLCNLECGLFLGKWLETIASALAQGGSLEENERRLLGIVTSIIRETDLGLNLHSEMAESRRIRCMAAQVIRLWAYTFKGAHVFDIMGTIGAGLDLCADMLQRELDGPE